MIDTRKQFQLQTGVFLKRPDVVTFDDYICGGGGGGGAVLIAQMWRWSATSPTNVILFVGDHPTIMSASSVGRVVCESILIILLHSCLLDKNRSITFVGAGVQALLQM